MVAILIISTKLTTLGFLKIKVFWNKGLFGVIICAHDVANKILSRDSNYIVDVTMWPNSGNSNIPVREVNHNLNFIRTWAKGALSSVSIKGLALDVALKFWNSEAKALKLKVRKFWGIIPTYVEITGKKLVGGLFAPSPFVYRAKNNPKEKNEKRYRLS